MGHTYAWGSSGPAFLPKGRTSSTIITSPVPAFYQERAGRRKTQGKEPNKFGISGEVTERPKVRHWKCRVGVKPHRGFESRPLR